ncbi:MAG: siroheme synthase CysG [Pseudomonadales bacterium]
MRYLPIFIDLLGKPCLIVGGGTMALRKAEMLSRAGAKLHIVAPKINDELATLVSQSEGEVYLRGYQQGDLNDKTLAIAATDDVALNEQLAIDARHANIPVNIVDQPDLCTFVMPSVVDRSPIVVAISSAGTAPVLARLLRARLETLIPARYGDLAKLAGSFRARVKQNITSASQRLRFWENVLQGPIAELVMAGRQRQAKDMLSQVLRDGVTDNGGEVYLVGAGPGDPDLLTFRALRLMQQADIVLYDRLVSPAILDLVRRDAERVYVGKARADHAVPQPDINKLLVQHARQGKRVLRLKGGDPFIFGRGGEEIETLAEQGVTFQVVPGITAASGCASYAGIPLTHRDYAHSVRFLTGHLRDGTLDLPWQDLVETRQTLVFYMGLIGLPEICRQLIANGRSANTPIALVQQGTYTSQRVIVGKLDNMAQKVAAQEVHAPTIIIVGEVVKLQPKLAWFNSD